MSSVVLLYSAVCCMLILVNMGRKYKRRTERGKFTAADLQDAARKVNEDKRSTRSVAREAGICHVTLNRYIKKHRDGIPSSIPIYNTESKLVFSEAQESELELYIKKAADIYFELSSKDVRVLAFQCAKKFNIKMPSTWEERVCMIRLVKRISKELPLVTSPLKALDFSGVLSEFGWGRSNVDRVGQMWMGLVKCGWGWIFS